MKSAALTQLNTPDARRPQAPEIQEQKKRPRIATTLVHIASLEASGGVILSTITNRVTCHKAKATPPVWVSPVREPAMICADIGRARPSGSSRRPGRPPAAISLGSN
jgi:hypothetical protein